MHLLMLTEDFYPSVSGGAHEGLRFAQIATRRGHHVSVVTPRKPETRTSEIVDGIEITRPFPARPSSLPPASSVATATRVVHTGVLYAWLQWWSRDREFDAVYSASNTLHWIASEFGRQHDIPSLSYIGYTPSMRPEANSHLKISLERLNFTYGLAESVFCRLPRIRDLIEEYSGKDVQLIHGILNEDRIRDGYGRAQEADVRSEYAGPDERLLVFAGRLSEEKNVPGVIEIFSQLPPSYRLVIIGDGPEWETVQRTIENQAVQEQVKMCGQLSHEETLSVIAVADGLLLPSHTEVYPTVAFEGLTFGCTVFATPVGILPEVDHPRLRLAPAEGLGDEIQSTSFGETCELDEKTLKQYSMERFADQILGAIEA
ncbi:glycosyltransferase family 4 protein [Salinibaculum salinum]|uniref:glycosyltransferase family 4 protein n=1 Tax=Salinibaculum salinum TaxID=3131996 RepID=UPI0030ED6D6A